MATTSIIVLIVFASVLTPTAFIIIGNAQNQMVDLSTQFIDVMNQTNGFLDNAWNVAEEFQNPEYNYNPSELGNYTIPEISGIGGN